MSDDSNNDSFAASPAQLEARGAACTAREIAQQPQVWRQVLAQVAQEGAALTAFLAPLLADPQLRIVLTGAGTSSFIGACLAPAMLARSDRVVAAVATTDLVAGPRRHLKPGVPTLLVSFARSGNSPESVAAVDLAEQTGFDCHHLVLTCNGAGALYRRCQSRPNAMVLLLPDATHDRAFAMTSSFTAMLLAAAAIFGVLDAGAGAARAGAAAAALMRDAAPLLHELVARRFERVVYLGSNELDGLAREAALKLLELSDGQVMAVHDTPLGFRHGPKTVVNERTLVVLFLSNDPYARHYDLDLLRELRADARAGRVLALSGQPGADADLVLRGMDGAGAIELALCYVVFAQLFGLLQSLQLGLRPDTPSVSGTVNRVVHGVTIHPWPGKDDHVPRR